MKSKIIKKSVAASFFSMALSLLLSHSVIAQISAIDGSGKPVVLAQPAKRIITLSPHAAELVAAAGALSEIVAVSESSDMPAAVKRLPVIGNAAAIDYERIVALRPDLIVAPAYLQPAQRALLKNYVLFIADAKTPEAIADEIASLGALTGHVEEAGKEVMRLRARLEALSSWRQERRITVFYLIWNDPIYTVGGTSLINQAIRFCGGTNVFSEMSASAPIVLREAVIQAAPELMIFGASKKDFDVWRHDWQRWTQIPAVQKQNIVRVDPDLLHRPGPRFIDGMASLCQVISAAKAQRF